LIEYQNERYALQYERFVEQVRAAEQALGTDENRLTEAVARHLFKLMAYKDEYEVARLALHPTMSSAVETQFGEGARVQWRLHPPTLKWLGMKRKISLGGWFRPAFVALHAMRGLRGSAFDVFGYDQIRRLERELLAEYRRIIADLLPGLTADTLDTAVQVAELPDVIRGYDEVKLRNVKIYRERMAELLHTA